MLTNIASGHGWDAIENLGGLIMGPLTELGKQLNPNNPRLDRSWQEEVRALTELTAEYPDDEEEGNELSSGDYEDKAEGYLQNLEEEWKAHKDEATPGTGSTAWNNLNSAIVNDLQQGQGMQDYISAVTDAPTNLATGAGAGKGYQDLETAATQRELARGDINLGVGALETAEGLFDTEQGKWENAKTTYDLAEAGLEQAGKDVQGAEITNEAHKNDEYGFQEKDADGVPTGPWHYWQGIDPDDADPNSKMEDNPATDWIDESRYTAGTLGNAYQTRDDLGMHTYTYNTETKSWDINENMGALGQAEGAWDLAQDVFNASGDWYWMNQEKPENWEDIAGAPDTPPDYDTTEGQGYWTRGTWGQAQDTWANAIDKYESEVESYQTGNKSAWEIWSENMSDLSSRAKGAGGQGEATREYHAQADEILRATGLAGSGAVERAEDVDVQRVASGYGSVAGDFSSELGQTRRLLDERLALNRNNLRDADTTRGLANTAFVNADLTHGLAGDENTPATGIFKAKNAAQAARDWAEDQYIDAGTTGINTARGDYNIAKGLYDTALGAFQGAYRDYGPPAADYTAGSGDYYGDELAGIELPEGGQIYQDLNTAQSVWDSVRTAGIGQGFNIPEMAPYGDPSSWGPDYSSIDFSDSGNWDLMGKDNFPTEGSFRDDYYDFVNNTLVSYGAPDAWGGGQDFTSVPGDTNWADAGIDYQNMYYHLQPNQGYSTLVEGALGKYKGDQIANYNQYIDDQKGLIGGGISGLTSRLIDYGASESERSTAEGVATDVWNDYIKGGKYGIANPSGAGAADIISNWVGGSLGDNSNFGMLDNYSVGASTMPGYNQINPSGYDWSF